MNLKTTLGAVALSATACISANEKKPNILYIMSDDHASNAISAYNSILAEVFKTPNLDRLANEGVRLNNFYSTNSICTPARASIMTGQYGHINGAKTLNDSWDPNCRENLATLLKNAGYNTALIGKWHLHCKPKDFDYFEILPNQGIYYDPVFIDQNADEEFFHRKESNPKDFGVKHKGYVTEIITDKTIDFLEKRDKDKPFFLMCHHKAPHDFWEYAKKYENLFDGVDIPVPDSLFEDRRHRSVATRDFGSSVTPRSKVRSLYEDFSKPDYITGQLKCDENATFKEKGIAAYQKYLKDYLRTVASIDESVGEILDHLEKSGELDNTIIIYTSDQGMFLGEHDYQDKRWSYEESIGTPFLVRYPKAIKAGGVDENLYANIDVAPTLLDFAGAEIPETMQGKSFRKELESQSKGGRDAIYFRYWMHLAHRHDNPAHYGIRTKKWKLIYFYGLPLDAKGAENRPTQSGWELYDMENDPQECNNLYDNPKYKDIIKELKIELDNLKKEFKDEDDQYPEFVKLNKG